MGFNFQHEMSRHEKLNGPRKITLQDISFESDYHNIYSPHFSSQPSESSSESLSDQYYDEEESASEYDSEESDGRQ